MEAAPSNGDFHAPVAPSLVSHPHPVKHKRWALGKAGCPLGPFKELGKKGGFNASAALLGGRFSGLTLPVESQGEDCVLTVQANRPRTNSQPPFPWDIRTDAFPKLPSIHVQASPWKT